MKPKRFKEQTHILRRPETMTEDECGALPVWTDGKQCISSWKPSIKERLRILFGGRVWLGCLTGTTQPPVYVVGECVFNRPSIYARVLVYLLNVGTKIKYNWRETLASFLRLAGFTLFAFIAIFVLSFVLYMGIFRILI